MTRTIFPGLALVALSALALASPDTGTGGGTPPTPEDIAAAEAATAAEAAAAEAEAAAAAEAEAEAAAKAKGKTKAKATKAAAEPAKDRAAADGDTATYRVLFEFHDKNTGALVAAGALVTVTEGRHGELKAAGVVGEDPAEDGAVDESEAARAARAAAEDDAHELDEAVLVGGGLAPGAPATMTTAAIPAVLTGGRRQAS